MRRWDKPEEELHTEKLCYACRQSLSQEPWNTKVDILICNHRCGMYRVPQGSVPIVEIPRKQLKKEMLEDGD